MMLYSVATVHNYTVLLKVAHYQLLNVTEFGKTDHIVTIDISRNADLKY